MVQMKVANCLLNIINLFIKGNVFFFSFLFSVNVWVGGRGSRHPYSVIQRITCYWILILLAVCAPGQAFVIFQKREVAEMAVAKLDEVCLMLSNGRYAAPSFSTAAHQLNVSCLVVLLY